jgi:hypothetical protein
LLLVGAWHQGGSARVGGHNEDTLAGTITRPEGWGQRLTDVQVACPNGDGTSMPPFHLLANDKLYMHAWSYMNMMDS